MAKSVIKKPPFHFSDALSSHKLFDLDYVSRYKETDEKGRYLYWDQFRWRVKAGDDPQKAWFAVKWARYSRQKTLSLEDKVDRPFRFCIPDTLNAKLFRISDLTNRGMVPHRSITKKYLISSLMMEEAISSSQLEGASTIRKIAKEMLVSHKRPRNKDEQMIVNNYLLMKEIKHLKDEALTVDMILRLHHIATANTYDNGNVPGKFRKSDDIIIADSDENVLHQPPHFALLPQRVQKLCAFANTDHTKEGDAPFIHPVVKAIILHFMIGYEHPFADGNGRTARALFYWFMLKSGFDYVEYVSISKLLKEAPKQYSLSYLYSEIDDNDLTYFIDYQADIILRAIDELAAYLQTKSAEFEEVAKVLEGSGLEEKLNFVQKDIMKNALKHPGRVFTAFEVSADYDLSPTTARKYLKELVEYKILARYKEGKTMMYIAPANLYDILNEK